MESVHQIITIRFSILNLMQTEVYRCYKNIWAGIKLIKSKLLDYRFEEDIIYMEESINEF